MNNHGESLGYSFNCCAVRMYLPERDNGVILSAIYNCVICSQAMIKFMLVIGCMYMQVNRCYENDHLCGAVTTL